MRNRILFVALLMAFAQVSCAQKQTDFTEVASQNIDGVVHIKTEMTKLTPLYQSFFGMIINPLDGLGSG